VAVLDVLVQATQVVFMSANVEEEVDSETEAVEA